MIALLTPPELFQYIVQAGLGIAFVLVICFFLASALGIFD